MPKYRIFETEEFSRALQSLDKSEGKFVRAKLKKYVYPQLQHQPYFGPNIKKLRNYDPETWRYKMGQFRLFYSMNEPDKVVNILTVNFRKDAYK